MSQLPHGARAVLLSLLVLLYIQNVSSSDKDDKALQQVRSALDAQSAKLLHWSPHTTVCGQRDCDERTCNWRGVACSKGQVIGINITAVVAPGQVSGELAEELGMLHALRYLVIADQHISGSLPESLSKLRSLVTLDLHNDSLSGTLPASWASLPVTLLDVSQNLLSGSVPSEWVTMASLKQLNLAGTGICGSWVDLHHQWPDATITHDMVMKTCGDFSGSGSAADSGRGQEQAPIDRKAKYTVLLVMYIVAGVFIVLCVIFLVGHTCLCFGRRMRARQQLDGGGLPTSAAPPPPPAASCPAPPPGPPPILIIMPGGQQMAVGYPVAGAGLKSIELTPAARTAAVDSQRSSPSTPTTGGQHNDTRAATDCQLCGPSTPPGGRLGGAGTPAAGQQGSASPTGAASATRRE